MAQTILERIVAAKAVEVATAKRSTGTADLRAQLADAPPIRSFFEPLAESGSISLIAEVKKASPSAGVIRNDFDPVEIAKTYEQFGASCVSVLTDEEFFQGSLKYLKAIRAVVGLPLLRQRLRH